MRVLLISSFSLALACSSGVENVASTSAASNAAEVQRAFADLSGTSGSVYVLTRDAELLWYGDQARNGTASWADNSGHLIASGWTGMKQAFSGGNGTIYVVDSSGALRWYKDLAHDGTSSWAQASGNTIGTGWQGMRTVFGGGAGNIYAIDASGNLLWYRDLAQNGTVSWATGSGSSIGYGWSGMSFVCSGGNGNIYAVDGSGNLRWYRDTAQNGTWSWAAGSGNVIGWGWQSMQHLTCGGDGVIYAVDANGYLRWYRDLAQNGTMNWAAGSGNVIGNGWLGISYSPGLEAFGYGSLKINGKSALGTRPLVMMLAQWADNPAFAHGTSYYDALAFGSNPQPPFTPSNPASLSAFVGENSNYRFAFTRAGNNGIVGPLSLGNFPSPDPGPEARLKTILTAASQAGFNFAQFDANNDGVITEDELLVVTVENISNALPANRANDTAVLNGKTVALGHVAMEGSLTPFDQFAHELMHSLGTADLYYSGCQNFRITTMSCAASFTSDDQPTEHLDAWHKFMLGWIEPKVQRITTSSSAYVMFSTFSRPDGSVLLWDRNRGTNEYFLLERRSPTTDEEAPPIYDANVADDGVAIWHVNGTGGHVVNRGRPNLIDGSNSLWRILDATPALTWNDGTSTNAHLSFLSNWAGYMYVTW